MLSAGWAWGLGAPLAFLLAFANGANDIANSMGTAVGARAMTMRQALLAGAAFEFISSMAIGPFVASKIASGQLHAEAFDATPTTFALVMLSALAGAGSTTFLATLYGYPISATHGVISGIIACSLCTGLPNTLDMSGFEFTLVGWVASPVVGMLAGMLVSVAIYKLITTATNPQRAAVTRQPVLLTLTSAVSCLFLLLKGPPFVTQVATGRAWLAVLLALGGGLVVTAIHAVVRGLLQSRAQRLYDEEGKAERGNAGTQLSTLGPSNQLSTLDHKDEPEPAALSRVPSFNESKGAIDALERPFVPLLIVAGLTVALAHGANDVGNAVGPLAVVLSIATDGKVVSTAEIPTGVLLLGAVGFVLGILMIGSRTISTVGSKITALTPQRSFSSQIGAAIAVLSSSVLGLPVSTSHCLVGAVFGVTLAEKICGVPDVDVDVGTLKKIVIGWVVTIPLAAAVAVCAYFPLSWIFL
ncbi:hypothetical protein AB1Y20_001635 [Prymnesium parvum]|uniref:Phosphate transporter n=1 Tax=Prymnesium parvum TaxID=97485 RepID=A0AB34K8V3_PRYPA